MTFLMTGAVAQGIEAWNTGKSRWQFLETASCYVPHGTTTLLLRHVLSRRCAKLGTCLDAVEREHMVSVRIIRVRR